MSRDIVDNESYRPIEGYLSNDHFGVGIDLDPCRNARNQKKNECGSEKEELAWIQEPP